MISGLALFASGVALAASGGCISRTARGDRDHLFAGMLCAAGYVAALVGVCALSWAIGSHR